MLRLVSILLSQLLDIWKKSNQGGLSIQLRGSNCWVKGPSSLILPFSLKVVLRNSSQLKQLETHNRCGIQYSLDCFYTVLTLVKYVGCLQDTVYQDPVNLYTILQRIIYILAILLFYTM